MLICFEKPTAKGGAMLRLSKSTGKTLGCLDVTQSVKIKSEELTGPGR